MPHLLDSRAIVTCPINRARLKKRLQVLSSFLYYSSFFVFGLAYSTGAEVGRFEHFVFLYISVCRDSNLLEYLDSC